jgi:hypothetical protein
MCKILAGTDYFGLAVDVCTQNRLLARHTQQPVYTTSKMLGETTVRIGLLIGTRQDVGRELENPWLALK